MTFAAAALILCLGPLQDADKDTSKDPAVRRISVDYDEVLLGTILADIQKRTGIPVEMDERAVKELDPSQVKISMKAQDLTVSVILALMLKPRSPVITFYWVENRKLVISTKDKP